jgi:hypothetical protein
MSDTFMFALGIFGVLQVIFLPGFLLCRILKMSGFLPTLIFSFGLSLIANYVLVFLLSLLGLYSIVVVRTILLVECIMLLIYLSRSASMEIPIPLPRIRLGKDLMYGTVFSSLPRQSGTVFLAAACTLALGWYIRHAADHFGTVFTSVDTVASWNRWAVMWFEENIPWRAKYYAQLIPMNWSLVYKLLGSSEIEIFNKAIMPFFSLFILLMFLDLGFRTKDSSYFIGLALCGLFLYKLYYSQRHVDLLVAGYTDIPVAFFAFLSFYSVVRGSLCLNSKNAAIRYVWLGGLAAAGAGITKQSGLFICFMYPAVAYIFVLRPLPGHLAKETAKVLVPLVVAMLALLSTWYAYVQVLMWQGVLKSKVAYLTGSIHGDRSYMQRLLHSCELLGKKMGRGDPRYIIVVVATTLISTIRPIGRGALLLLALPYLLIWAFLFGYDLRNMSLAVPFIALACGVGCHVIFRWIGKALPAGKAWIEFEWLYAKGPRRANVLIGLLVLLFGSNFVYTAPILKKHQLEKQRDVGNPELNKELIAFFKVNPPSGKIWSNYYGLRTIPGLKEYHLHGNARRYKHYANRMARNDVHYLLFRESSTCDPRVREDIRRGISEEKYAVLFDKDSWILLKKSYSRD